MGQNTVLLFLKSKGEQVIHNSGIDNVQKLMYKTIKKKIRKY